VAEKLKKMRWKLLRKGSRVRGRAKRRLWAACSAASWPPAGPGCSKKPSKTSGATAPDLGRRLFWRSGTRALRSRLEPMKKVARMLRSHEDLLMNWFKAKGEISSGAVEG
jgi:hypothetical protein